jgi:hypothetical protein
MDPGCDNAGSAFQKRSFETGMATFETTRPGNIPVDLDQFLVHYSEPGRAPVLSDIPGGHDIFFLLLGSNNVRVSQAETGLYLDFNGCRFSIFLRSSKQHRWKICLFDGTGKNRQGHRIEGLPYPGREKIRQSLLIFLDHHKYLRVFVGLTFSMDVQILFELQAGDTLTLPIAFRRFQRSK